MVALLESERGSSAPEPTPAAVRPRAGRTTRWVFTAATFVSATLLFLVQPMVAKMLLPELGGSAAVWNTAAVFFQTVLLAGYALAHVSLRRLGVRRQPILQLALVGAALLVLPVALPAGWSAPAGSPSAWTLLVLTVMVGLPFLVLATVSPTLQRWFSATDHPQADDPYFLYAAGNVGSLLALVAYPLVLEPRFSLGAQSGAWALGYAVFAALAIACAVLARRHRAAEAEREVGGSVVEVALTARTRLRWVGFAAVPSALMLGVTRHIASDVAAMPLLWVAPLALYLGTFVVAFGKRPDRAVAISSRALKLLVVPLALSFYGLLSSLVVGLALNLALFTAAAMVAHGRLAQERPAPSRLTDFYLMMSVGGVLGGAVAALVAPLVFTTILEYPVAIVASLALLPRSAFDGPTAAMARTVAGVPRSWVRAGALGLGVGVALLAAVVIRSSGTDEALTLAMAVAGAGAALVYITTRTPAAFTVGIGAILAVAVLVPANPTTFEARTFYGVHRVYVDQANDDRHVLLNGSTVHGMEYVRGETAGQPTTYYHPSGPVGQWFDRHADDPQARRIGVVGLGSGAVAWYGRDGDQFDFYEIDQAVVDIAQRRDLFTFLDRSSAEIGIEVGDGRVLLDQATETYDALLIDAFSGDSIPAHLLTDEAVELYLDRIAPDGAIVFHISNRFFDFSPVISRLAHENELVAYQLFDDADAVEAAQGKLPSTWVVVARTDTDAAVAGQPGWVELTDTDGPLWTDDRSDLLTLMR